MIALEHVTKVYHTGSGPRTVLNDINFRLEKGQKIGVLGRNGAGKSTLIPILSSVEPPTSGRVIKDMRISWPLAFGGGFQGSLTGMDNMRFICRVYGADMEYVRDFVEDFSELGGFLKEPLKRYSSGMRARLAFAISMAIEFDCFLIDEVIAVGDRVTVSARFAVVAVPPNLYDTIDYAPPLPRARQVANQHRSMGLVIKAQAVYETPFWRDNGLSGTGFGSRELVCEVYDNTVADSEHGTLVGFIVSDRADEAWNLPEDERRAAVLDSLAGYFGERAKEPIAFYLSDWGSEQWTRGAYACSYEIGGLARFGHLQNQPVGPIFFASSDIQGIGYMHVDGGVRIGDETAQRISARLRAVR